MSPTIVFLAVSGGVFWAAIAGAALGAGLLWLTDTVADRVARRGSADRT